MKVGDVFWFPNENAANLVVAEANGKLVVLSFFKGGEAYVIDKKESMLADFVTYGGWPVQDRDKLNRLLGILLMDEMELYNSSEFKQLLTAIDNKTPVTLPDYVTEELTKGVEVASNV